MNIEEYRAMIAQEAEQTNSNVEEQSHVQAEQGTTQPNETNNPTTQQGESLPPSTEPEVQTQAPLDFIEIDGKQVSVEELRNGYLRQSDYTRKTQEVARQKQELAQAEALMERIKENPELAQSVGYDAEQAKYDALRQEHNDLLLEREIESLSTKYADFDANEVLNLAMERDIMNLEDAYLLNKSIKQPSAVTTPAPIDLEAIKNELRAQLLAELREADTTTIIASNGGTAPTAPSAPQLSDAELRVARNMGMTPEEYEKFRG